MGACSRSNKSLWSLVSGRVLQTNPSVLEGELTACSDLLAQGLLNYGQGTKSTETSQSVPESWKDFNGKVGRLTGLSERKGWDIICSYLATEFRGTKDSLKELIKDEQKTRPLILDVWQFYRAERLYLLQIIKHIVTVSQTRREPQNKEANQEEEEEAEEEDTTGLSGILCKLLDSGKGGLTSSLVDQLAAVTAERAPETDLLGPSLAASCTSSWIHYNLRETSELVQILLISLHVNGFSYQDIEKITEIFHGFSFGSKLPFKNELDETNSRLVNNIKHLTICSLILMLDLPGLSTNVQDHKIWGSPGHTTKMERLISGLGNQPSHSPALLAWTLSCFLAKGQQGLSKAGRLGEIALANRVLKTLEQILLADFNSHFLIADIINLQVYSVVSVLLTVFDPVSMGLKPELDTLANILLKQRSVAAHVWRQSPNSGLALYFSELMQNFPRDFSPVVCLDSLASASPWSCQQTVAYLANLQNYNENLEDITSRIGRNVDGSLELLEDRFPYSSTKTIWIPAKTKGELQDGGSVKWETRINGWQIMLAECANLLAEISSGEEQVKHTSLSRVTRIANLVAKVINSSPSLAPKLDEVTSLLGNIAHRFCQVSHPPLQLLSGITKVFASIAKSNKSPQQVLDALKKTGLLPHFSLHHSLLERSSSSTLVPGVVGVLLAEDETVSGEYPLLLSALHTIKECAICPDVEPCLVFVCREVMPNFSNWRYQNAGEREEILRLSLSIILQFITEVRGGGGVVAAEHQVCLSLLAIVCTGDRTIQNLLENQESWEQGRGTDYCKIVGLALNILDRLVASPKTSGTVLAGPVGAALRAPPTGTQSHLILTLAQYSYFLHDPSVATAAIRLLGSMAAAASRAEDSVSMLACLGNSASSVRDLLLARLESPVEDIRLKIGVFELLSECVRSQPGMIQLLLDISTNVVVVNASVTADASAAKPRVVGEGCLGPALELLAECREPDQDNVKELHLSIVKLVYNLWDTSSLLATRYLKDVPNFWKNLCWPIAEPIEDPDHRHIKVKAFVLRILANEIYSWKGKVSSELAQVLEKICDEKRNCLSTWCKDLAVETSQEESVEEEDGVVEEDEWLDPHNLNMFLISSWRIFLLVLSKDNPVAMSPVACRSTYMAGLDKLMEVVGGTDPPPIRLTLLLAETATVLMKRWQTKCSDNMESLVKQMTGILELLECNWSSLLARARLAILALALSTLRVSQFKLDQEQESSLLRSWLAPCVRILALSFRDVKVLIAKKKQGLIDLQGNELTISLLQNLIARIPEEKVWLSALHTEATLQLLLSAAGACLRQRAAPSWLRRLLQLMGEIAAKPRGAAALLAHDLAQQLWLPLAAAAGSEEWQEACLLALEFVSILLRTGGSTALETAITAMALLSDNLTAHLTRPRSSLVGLSGAATVARLIGYLSGHINSWRTEHQASLVLMYRCCSSLLEYCTALLMRPVLLASMLKMSRGSGWEEEFVRSRHLSTASCGDLELEVIPPEAVSAHSLLLDICMSCLTLIQSLSPGLPALLTGDALLDPERWENLLSLSFKQPSLDQDADSQLSYGTILALANTCVRSMARDEARSPSPSRSASSVVVARTGNAPESADKSRLSLLLEKCLVVVLCQAILTLSQATLPPTDKQLLRRELGAELGSITDSWRRQLTRGGAKSPRVSAASAPSPSSRSKSPQLPPSTSPQPPSKQKQDELFVKFVDNLVNNVFK